MENTVEGRKKIKTPGLEIIREDVMEMNGMVKEK